MKKILQISNYMYPHIGGIEQVARDFASALPNDEYEQKIICFNENASDGNYICRRKETVHDFVDGIEIIRCGCFAKIDSQSLSFTYPYQLRKVITSFKPDVIVFHYPNPFVATFLLKYLKSKVKFILYWHLDITKQRTLEKFFRNQTLSLLKRADVIVATSPNYIKGSAYLRRFRRKCVVIPPCINSQRMIVTDKIREKAVSIRRSVQGKTICFTCGRHVPYKGINYLIQASKMLSESFCIFIGGTGELAEELKSEAKGDQKVHFLGHLSDADLVAYLLACDIFCFPSITKNEAFGIALAEGMYFGKPAVTFTIPGSGVNYVNLDGVTGIECPNGDANAYAEAIEKLATDKALYQVYGENARHRVLDNFTEKQFKEKVQRLIKKVFS